MKTDITALNLITIDFVYSGLERLPGLGEEVSTTQLDLALGGGPVASLVTASRLGAEVKLATSLGDDRFSLLARDFLEREQVSYRSFEAALHRGQSPVNVSSVMSIPALDRSFVSYFPDTEFYTHPSEAVFEFLRESRYCIASSPNAELFRRLKESGCRVVYDVGWSDGLCIESIADVLSSVYLFAPNEKEACKLTGTDNPRDALLRLANYVEQPIVKCGKNGALFLRDHELVHAAPFAFQAIDATGAGDAFLGGVVYGLSRNWELGRCVELGNYTGGKATTGIGCLTARASLQEFDELCRNR